MGKTKNTAMVSEADCLKRAHSDLIRLEERLRVIQQSLTVLGLSSVADALEEQIGVPARSAAMYLRWSKRAP